MSIVLAVVNQKGGVGKTTTVVNLGACLAELGKKTLIIDLDPQGNATSGAGIDKSLVGISKGRSIASIYDVLVNELSICAAVAPTTVERLSIVPATLDLAGSEVELMPRIAREASLRNALEPVRDSFDIIMIDAPPSLGLLTVNALVAADSVLIPIQCEYYALEGVSQLMKTIEMVRRQVNTSLDIAMVLLTMYDNRVKLNQQVVAEVRQAFGDKVARKPIPRNSRLAEAPSHGLPISLYDPKCRGAQAYRDLAQEVLRIEQKSAG